MSAFTRSAASFALVMSFASDVFAGEPESSRVSGWKEPEIQLPIWSNELLDPAGLSRANVVTRAMFSDGTSVFSGASAWSLELQMSLRIVDGIAVSATLPLGVRVLEAPGTSQAFLGNIGLGFSAGAPVSLGPDVQLRFGGGLELFLPTSSEQNDTGWSAVAAMRAYTPQLHIPQLLSARLRGHVDLTFDVFRAEVEVGVSPGGTLGWEELMVLFSGAGRVSVQTSEALEAFLEVGATTQLAGDGEIATPFLLSPGVRLHVTELFQPALFASFNFIDPAAIIFGVDLGGALSPSAKKPSVRRSHGQVRDELDF